jgi:2-polyprenyl-3-methyl-5-hydroxy-6-metoxy-1,4-benzoquinol methylase
MPQTSAATECRFEFGRNWQSLVETCLDEERITAAIASLRRILAVDDLHGRSFLDVGCGSGLFSLAAARLDAERVVGFDMDVHSVQASLDLRAHAAVPVDRWQIQQGSVLDEGFLATIEPAGVVSAWGVLHHTGALWQAMDNAVSKVKPGGVIAIAIYNKVERRIGSSAQWWHIKRFYNHSPQTVRRLIEYVYVGRFIAGHLLTVRNPLAHVRNYGKAGRGMDFRHDVRDWVGGFPSEYATAGEVFNYLHGKFGLQLRYLNSHDGHTCNEFTFARPLTD